MRGPSSSSKQSNRRSIEIDRPKTKEDPPLSSAYILNPVNQVTNHPKSPTASLQDQLQPQPQRPKRKQVRRRLHSSRPYQQKLLNTAEARKEIVAALKLHRAAMQQASRQQQPSHTLQLEPPRNIYQSNSFVPSYNQPSPLFPSFTSSFSPGDCTPTSPLPIGLNLNLQSLINIVTPMFGNSGMHHSLLSHSTSSSSNYSSSSLPSASTDFTDDAVAARLHPAMNMPAGLSDHKAGKDGSGCYLSLDHSLDEFLQDVPLPCLDIAAAEMLEGEWLS